MFSVGYTKFLGLVVSHFNKKEIRRHVDIRLIPETYFIPAYFYYTSGREFNKIIREKAKRKGLKLSEWGLTDIITNDGDVFTVYDWKEYKALDEHEIIEFHIGGHSKAVTEQAKNEMYEAMANLK